MLETPAEGEHSIGEPGPPSPRSGEPAREQRKVTLKPPHQQRYQGTRPTGGRVPSPDPRRRVKLVPADARGPSPGRGAKGGRSRSPKRNPADQSGTPQVSAESIKDLEEKVQNDLDYVKKTKFVPGYLRDRMEKRAAKLASLRKSL